jgi:hypothetical protein
MATGEMTMTTQRRSTTIRAACGHLLLVGLVAACSRPVEVKQDTPQATIASLIKLYASPKEESRVAELIDPVVVRAHGRQGACLAEQLKSLQCDQALLKAIATRSFGAQPEGCPVKLTDCTCGAKGSEAAAKASAFTTTDAHAGLKAIGMNVDSCRIKSADALNAEALAHLDGRFWDYACSDATKTDPLSSVAVECGDAGASLTFILRQRDAKWSVVGFSTDTNVKLWEKKIVEKARQRESDLNKDMK